MSHAAKRQRETTWFDSSDWPHVTTSVIGSALRENRNRIRVCRTLLYGKSIYANFLGERKKYLRYLRYVALRVAGSWALLSILGDHTDLLLFFVQSSTGSFRSCEHCSIRHDTDGQRPSVDIGFLLLPPKKEAMFSGLSVCLFVCLFVYPLDYPETSERILMKYFGEVGLVQGPSD